MDLEKNKITQHSRKREMSGASAVGGHSHIGSGNIWSMKSDFSNEMFQFEDKFTLNNTKYILMFVKMGVNIDG